MLKDGSGNAVVFDATESRTLNYNSTIPEYPTEAGYKVSDAVLKSLPAFSVDGIISGMSINGGSTADRMYAYIELLKSFYFDARILTYYSGGGSVDGRRRAIKNLIIETLSLPEEASFGKAVQVQMTFKQMQFPSAATAAFSVSSEYDLGGNSRAIGDANYVEAAPNDRFNVSGLFD